VAFGLQLVAQESVVVNLSVEDDPDGSVLVAERLVPGGEVDNAEAPHADADSTIRVNAFVIRPAVDHRAAHLPESRRLNSCALTEFHDSSDAAHIAISDARLPQNAGVERRTSRIGAVYLLLPAVVTPLQPL
jgi:hypothetical protein